MALADKGAGADARAVAVQVHVEGGGHDAADAGRTRCPAMKSKAVGGAARQSIGQPVVPHLAISYFLHLTLVKSRAELTFYHGTREMCFPSILVTKHYGMGERWLLLLLA